MYGRLSTPDGSSLDGRAWLDHLTFLSLGRPTERGQDERVTNADSITAAAHAVASADALLLTAGAGMGVDSGLPDFRGDEGFWNAYPPYRHLGLSFVDLANPRWFEDDPHLAWGFYGHRLNLYRATRPHAGFAALARWGAAKPLGAFVFTSNVDGQFQRAEFDPQCIVECHGAIDTWQCTHPCGFGIFPAPPGLVMVDPRSFRAVDPLPRCPGCAALARPNVLMFGDDSWQESRTRAQRSRLEAWLGEVKERRGGLAIVECGAGTAVPTVRLLGEALARRTTATLIRINLREPEAPSGAIAIAAGARDAIDAIDQCLSLLAPPETRRQGNP
jgi:NAD-dependent SIR2 family protein deacetylase